MEEFPFFAEGDPVFSAAGKLPPGVISEKEFPVCRAPVVVPEPVFFDDCQPQRFNFFFARQRDSQLAGDLPGHLLLGGDESVLERLAMEHHVEAYLLAGRKAVRIWRRERVP